MIYCNPTSYNVKLLSVVLFQYFTYNNIGIVTVLLISQYFANIGGWAFAWLNVTGCAG